MPLKRRPFSVFTLSFLDVMCCGFGAVVLMFMILQHEAIVQEQVQQVDLSAEVTALQAQIAAVQTEIHAAQNNSASIDQRIAALITESASARALLAQTRAQLKPGQAPVVTSRDIDALRMALKKLDSEKQLVLSQLNEQSRDVRQFMGQGNREYLTGIRTGGKRVLILLDNSSSMLDESIVNVLRKKNMDTATKQRSEKWRQALDTVDWITARLQPGTEYQLYTFSGSARPVVPGSEGRWLAVDNATLFNQAVLSLKATVPEGGSNLARALQVVGQLNPRPDNVFLITDGLPTMGLQPPSGRKVSGERRNELFTEALRQIPQPAPPINVVLLPLEGDPMAAWAYWSVAMYTRGAFLTPAYDWP
ncbi:MAG: VWA domain-containing protein [Gammaproteobacteria bacterium]|nr:VWA domain-containing protein [Gammaproteobacteria bacterium]